MPICTDTALPSIETTVLPFMYQPKLPVENSLTSASISWPLITTLIGSAFSMNCVLETGHDVLGGMATTSDQKLSSRATFGPSGWRRWRLASRVRSHRAEVALTEHQVRERD